LTCLSPPRAVVATVSPSGTLAAPGVSRELLQSYWWAPLRDAYWQWCQVDPLLCVNPAWMKAMNALSPVFCAARVACVRVWLAFLTHLSARADGPFYVVALYAIATGKEWIRVPCMCYAWGLFVTLTVILYDERFGDFRTPNFTIVLLANLPYWIPLPLFIMYRFAFTDHPFTRPAAPKKQA
jgi:hypothetical protein